MAACGYEQTSISGDAMSAYSQERTLANSVSTCGWLRVRSALQLRKCILDGLDRPGFALFRELVSVDDQRQAILVLADDSALLHQVVVEADNAVRPYWLCKAFDGQGRLVVISIIVEPLDRPVQSRLT